MPALSSPKYHSKQSAARIRVSRLIQRRTNIMIASGDESLRSARASIAQSVEAIATSRHLLGYADGPRDAWKRRGF